MTKAKSIPKLYTESPVQTVLGAMLLSLDKDGQSGINEGIFL